MTLTLWKLWGCFSVCCWTVPLTAVEVSLWLPCSCLCDCYVAVSRKATLTLSAKRSVSLTAVYLFPWLLLMWDYLYDRGEHRPSDNCVCVSDWSKGVLLSCCLVRFLTVKWVFPLLMFCPLSTVCGCITVCYVTVSLTSVSLLLCLLSSCLTYCCKLISLSAICFCRFIWLFGPISLECFVVVSITAPWLSHYR